MYMKIRKDTVKKELKYVSGYRWIVKRGRQKKINARHKYKQNIF